MILPPARLSRSQRRERSAPAAEVYLSHITYSTLRECGDSSRLRGPDQQASAEAGFTVLEAIVAVAILGLAMLPLLSLQVQTSQGAVALERAVDSRIAHDVGMAFLRLVDPVQTPTGTMSMGGGWTLSWEAEPMAAERTAIAGWLTPTRHAVTLVRLRGVVSHLGGRVIELDAISASVRETRPYTTAE